MISFSSLRGKAKALQQCRVNGIINFIPGLLRFGWIASSLTLFSMTAFIAPAQATPVVADLSNYNIAMDAGFTGTRMFLFGARNDPGDVVVVVRGPVKNYIIRKKEKMAGLWINRDRIKFFNVPDFYAVGSSRPLADIASPALLQDLGIGENTLLAQSSLGKSAAGMQDFSQAFLAHQYEKRLYSQEILPIDFMAETLFKTTIEFPDTIPPGEYTAEIYLLSGGDVAGMQSIPITVNKSGIDAFLFNYAHNFPALYGISAIVLALAAGWFAARLFEKA